MKLTKLKLSNFRQFYGEQELEFSIDPHKHITLIHGENTVGKSAILNAVMWCLFGKVLHNYNQPHDLVNREAANSRAAERICKVTVEFEHEETLYSATRTYNSRTKNDDAKVFQIVDGDFRPIRHAKSLINLIVPEDMADYFFFEGEGLIRMGENEIGRDSAEAIRTILGFRYVNTVIEDLDYLRTKVRAELRKKQREQTGQASLIQEIETYEKAIDKTKATKAKLEKSIKESSAELKELNSRIGQSGHEDAEKAQKELSRLETQERGVKQDIIDVRKQRQLLISKYGWVIFGSTLFNKTLDFIEQGNYRGRIPPPHVAQIIRELLEDEKCICGSDLKPGTALYDKVESQLHTAVTAQMHNRVIRATAVAAEAKGRFSEFLDEVKNLERQYLKLQTREAELIANKDIQEKIIKNIAQSNIQQLVTKKESAERKLNKAKDELRHELQDRASDSNNLERLRAELRKNTVQQGVAMKLARQEALYALLIKRCTDRLTSFEKEALEFLETTNNEALKKISRQELKFVLNDDFTFKYLDGADEEIGRSTGETLLSKLIFVSSLIQFAKERVNVKDEFVIHGTIAPFLIDAPFGVLDEEYKKEVAKYIPQCTEQLILLLSTSHWTTIDDHIKERIGREYVLINHQTIEKGERTEDVITIPPKNGEVYKLSKYEASIRMSSIQEIRR